MANWLMLACSTGYIFHQYSEPPVRKKMKLQFITEDLRLIHCVNSGSKNVSILKANLCKHQENGGGVLRFPSLDLAGSNMFFGGMTVRDFRMVMEVKCRGLKSPENISSAIEETAAILTSKL